ncbi:alpha/beta fold hydrolase [Conexibacter sp. W3-3-2]|uniref:alpha/beta fold hydrolase n=1 Tax=Conexibacter sp. W3-3-2 TaxID=2675227 RepID=UPI0012B93CC4|nr:alpha/beta hydrolase [Conexibacter sp. W3-3-2]MTD44611.1 alpha/beta fold hydrolase [Conexibacter sp. W3-3-2]
MLGFSTSRWVRAPDGTRLHAAVSAPPGRRKARSAIVLVHGFTMDHTFWDRQVEVLREHHLVIAMDQRGHGRSDPAGRDGWHHHVLGRDVEAVVRALVPDGLSATAVGHSMGGMALMGWAAVTAHAPHERQLDAVVLANTTAHGVPNGIVLRLPPWISAQFVYGLAPLVSLPLPLDGRLAPVVRPLLRHLAFGERASRRDVATTERLFFRTDPRQRADAARFLWRLDARDGIEALAGVDVTVLVGGRDRLTPAARGNEIAQALDAPVILLARCGHQAPMEDAGAVTEVILHAANQARRLARRRARTASG